MRYVAALAVTLRLHFSGEEVQAAGPRLQACMPGASTAWQCGTRLLWWQPCTRIFQEKRSKLPVPGFMHACLALALHGNTVSSCCGGDVALLRPRWRYAQRGNLDETAALLVFLVLRMHKPHVRAPDIDTCKRLSKFPACMADISLEI